MNSKLVIYFAIFVGSGLGSYIPTLWGAGYFSAASIIGGLISSIVGLWVSYKVNKYILG